MQKYFSFAMKLTLTKLTKDGEDCEVGEDGGSGRPSQIPKPPSVKKHLCLVEEPGATHGGLDGSWSPN